MTKVNVIDECSSRRCESACSKTASQAWKNLILKFLSNDLLSHTPIRTHTNTHTLKRQ